MAVDSEDAWGQMTIRLPAGLFRRLEAARGSLSRNSYVVGLIERDLASLPADSGELPPASGEKKAKKASKASKSRGKKREAPQPDMLEAVPEPTEEEEQRARDEARRTQLIATIGSTVEEMIEEGEGTSDYTPAVLAACFPYATVADVNRRMGIDGWELHLDRLIELGLIEYVSEADTYRPVPQDDTVTTDTDTDPIEEARRVMRGERRTDG